MSSMEQSYRDMVNGYTSPAADSFQKSMREVLRWASLVSASKARWATLHEMVDTPSGEAWGLKELIDQNDWMKDHDAAMQPMIESTSILVRQAEERFIQERGQFLDEKQLVRAANVRSMLFYRNAVSGVVNTAQHVQISDPEIRAKIAFLVYVSAHLPTTRPTHAAMHGFVAVASSDIWRVVRPPNGYNCMCTLKIVGWQEAQRRKLLRANGAPRFEHRWPSQQARRNFDFGIFPDEGWAGPKFSGKV